MFSGLSMPHSDQIGRYLHENHGLVHADLKPENIVFVRELTKLTPNELRRRRNEGGPGTILRIVDFGVSV